MLTEFFSCFYCTTLLCLTWLSARLFQTARSWTLCFKFRMFSTRRSGWTSSILPVLTPHLFDLKSFLRARFWFEKNYCFLSSHCRTLVFHFPSCMIFYEQSFFLYFFSIIFIKLCKKISIVKYFHFNYKPNSIHKKYLYLTLYTFTLNKRLTFMHLYTYTIHSKHILISWHHNILFHKY